MIIFLDEDRAYLAWVTHHRPGFVLDARRKLSKKHVTMHRANCPEVRHASTRHTHWTTGQHLKACAMDAVELVAWVREQIDVEPNSCETCLPTQDFGEAPQGHSSEPHLTRLDRDILSFVLEIAAIHLDDPDSSYALDVGDIARCLQKTPGQLTAAVERLAKMDMIVLNGPFRPEGRGWLRTVIAPTARALRTLPVYSAIEDERLEAELARLHAAIA
jgi:hypothetical protein